MHFKSLTTNEQIFMTRRYPNLRKKVLMRDSTIVAKMVKAWDIEHDEDKFLNLFLSQHANLSDERYWEIMRTVWMLCGTVKNADIFRKLMQSPRKEKYYFSTPEEQNVFRLLPNEFVVYRAANVANDGGLSWTLSIEYAEHYKDNYSKARIFTRTVSKSEVFAYIERGAEAEIIIL